MATRLYVYGMGWVSLSCGGGGGTDGRIRPAPRATADGVGWSAGGGGQAARRHGDRPASSGADSNPMRQPHQLASTSTSRWQLSWQQRGFFRNYCRCRTMEKRRRGGVRIGGEQVLDLSCEPQARATSRQDGTRTKDKKFRARDRWPGM